jgi:carbamoyl-phosphate synthase large subunit
VPKRTDIRNILIIGSGPIVIGQGAEFDYSGTQACKALREEGFSVVLINSNPATIMTDPDMADRTYIEPITPEFIEKIFIREREDGRPVHALLPTLGGQTGLNCVMECHERGILERYSVEMIGAKPEAIHKAENRTAFKQTMIDIGLDVPRSGLAHTWSEAQSILKSVHLPCCIRPAYTLGGEGGGFCRTAEEFETIARRGLEASRVSEILIEESLYGWKEFELELMRDRADNVVIICGIENLDPMGVHTGDSITVAPIQTLSDREYQIMRDSAIQIIRAIGVETGGCNIQFAVNPATGRQCVVEMNPRVSRSSALASKATGYPIARIAAKLAVGYTLDELPNDITKTTPASFEPTIDYVVVKIPRWTFEKFPDCDETLTTQMKSVGEAMAIGRTFKEAFQKCIRSMEIQRFGFGLDDNDAWLRGRQQGNKATGEEKNSEHNQGSAMGGTSAGEAPPDTEEELAKDWPIPFELLREKLQRPSQGRPYYIRYALKMGWPVEKIGELTDIDPWFLDQMAELIEEETTIFKAGTLPAAALRRAKSMGYSNVQLAAAMNRDPSKISATVSGIAQSPTFNLVDTCAAEFEAQTPYYYSSYEHRRDDHGPRGDADEIRESNRLKVIILGGGPNRIGQGIEFDYCCCHASFAARNAGLESVMVNSNPETVSTDFDTSDLLFFEPLTHEDVLNIVRRLASSPAAIKGVIVQFGGQTPLNLAQGLKDAGVPILGTQPEMIHLAEDREQFQKVLRELSLLQPPNGIARDAAGARTVASSIGYPVLVRPSYVLGGRGMKVCNNQSDLDEFLASAFAATDRRGQKVDNPILIDKFLVDAIEVDVDAIADYHCSPSRFQEQGRGEGGARENRESYNNCASSPPASEDGLTPSTCIVAGIMEHIEEAGIHSGDSTAVLPPFSLGQVVIEDIFRSTKRLAKRLQVCGAMNVQYAVHNRTVYVLEVNPRASRTLPFVAKSTGVPWARIATRVMLGESLQNVLAEYGVQKTPFPAHTSIKAPVFPFSKFPGVDVILGPEMRSTGEAMAIAPTFGQAFAKAQIATGFSLPTSGNVLVSVCDPDKPRIVSIARDLYDLGFQIFSTVGTQKVLQDAGIATSLVSKSQDQGGAPFLLDLILDGTLHLLINTPIRTGPASAEGRWRAAATAKKIPLITTLAGARAAVSAIRSLSKSEDGEEPTPLTVQPLQAYFAPTGKAAPSS